MVGIYIRDLGLKLLQCLDSLFFWILTSYCSILLKVKMFILVWVSWSHSCCFYSFRLATKYLWRNLTNCSYLWIKVCEDVLICNKDIRTKVASSLTYDGWKALTSLVKTWSSGVLPIDHQYYKYTLVHELIGDREAAFCKQYRNWNCWLAFGRHSLINKLKKGNEADKPSTEAASFLSPKSRTIRTCSSTGNTKQIEQICFVCNEIHPCYSNAYNEGGWVICELKSAGDQLMDAVNAIGEKMIFM